MKRHETAICNSGHVRRLKNPIPDLTKSKSRSNLSQIPLGTPPSTICTVSAPSGGPRHQEARPHLGPRCVPCAYPSALAPALTYRAVPPHLLLACSFAHQALHWSYLNQHQPCTTKPVTRRAEQRHPRRSRLHHGGLRHGAALARDVHREHRRCLPMSKAKHGRPTRPKGTRLSLAEAGRSYRVAA